MANPEYGDACIGYLTIDGSKLWFIMDDFGNAVNCREFDTAWCIRCAFILDNSTPDVYYLMEDYLGQG